MNARTHYETLAKQAAGEKVDALAHLQILANDMRAAGKPMSADRLDVIRTALAELIEAANRTVRYADSEPDGDQVVEVSRANIRDLRVALARATGGPSHG